MKFNRTKNLTRTFIFGIISKLITILCPFITRTIIIYKLGAEYLGITSLFTSVLTILNVSELGISSAVSFCLYKPIAEDNKEVINALMGFMKKIYRIIGIFILSIGLVILPFLDKFISGSYPSEINIYVLYIIYLLNSVVSYLGFSYKGILFEAYQNGDVNHKVLLIIEIIKYIIQTVVLLWLENYYIFASVLPLSSIAITVIIERCSKKYYPDIIPRGRLSREYKKLIKNKISFLAAHSIAATLTNSVDNIVISGSLGLFAITIYGNYNYIFTAIVSILIIAYRAIAPVIGNSLYTDTEEKKKNLSHVVELLTMWGAMFCSICLLCLYQPFIELWVGKKYLLDFNTVVLIVLYFYVNVIKLSYSNIFIQVAGLWNKTLLRQYLVAGINLILDILLVRKCGIRGVVFASFFSIAVCGLPMDIVVTYKYVLKEKSINGFMRVAKYLSLFAILGTITYRICSWVTYEGYTSFILKLLICLIIPNFLMCIIEVKTKEFIFIIKKIKKLFERI